MQTFGIQIPQDSEILQLYFILFHKHLVAIQFWFLWLPDFQKFHCLNQRRYNILNTRCKGCMAQWLAYLTCNLCIKYKLCQCLCCLLEQENLPSLLVLVGFRNRRQNQNGTEINDYKVIRLEEPRTFSHVPQLACLVSPAVYWLLSLPEHLLSSHTP